MPSLGERFHKGVAPWHESPASSPTSCGAHTERGEVESPLVRTVCEKHRFYLLYLCQKCIRTSRPADYPSSLRPRPRLLVDMGGGGRGEGGGGDRPSGYNNTNAVPSMKLLSAVHERPRF